MQRFTCLCLALAALLVACGSVPPASETRVGPDAALTVAAPGDAGGAERPGRVLAQSDRFVIYEAGVRDTLRSVAARFLGSEERHWVIGDFNGVTGVQPGQTLVVPLKTLNPTGVYADHYQTVPILCYHRFGTGGGKMVVSPVAFAAQLDWLARNQYRVIRLSQLVAYLEGREPLPKRSVVITIDDGYESVYRYALPLLRQHDFAATLFIYTDFVGARDAMSWAQLDELARSGLIDIQSHSKSHRNLIERVAQESDSQYRQGLESETRGARQLLEQRLPVQVRHFAFPYGDANEQLLEILKRNDYQLAVTVNPGGNAFFAQPLMLRRTMIFGDHDLEAFKARLQVSRGIDSP